MVLWKELALQSDSRGAICKLDPLTFDGGSLIFLTQEVRKNRIYRVLQGYCSNRIIKRYLENIWKSRHSGILKLGKGGNQKKALVSRKGVGCISLKWHMTWERESPRSESENRRRPTKRHPDAKSDPGVCTQLDHQVNVHQDAEGWQER